ncbi:MAG: single-stranded DNA-binding protein [Planctomycetes bacterium]|nr:single-stranded DNA-binding protein [Planctomycetota bacterium]
MAGFNRVILIGNLTRDPELRYTPQGTAVADLRLAVTTVRGRSGSERKEETLFIDCTVWDRQAETCSEYLSKGRPVLVEGRLIEDQWQDKETGERRSRIKVYVQNVQFLGGRDGSGMSGRFDSGASGRYDSGNSGRYDAGSDDRSSRRQPARGERPAAPPARPAATDVFDDDSRAGTPAGDDIPF